MLVLGDHSLKIGSGATPRGGKSSYLDTGPFSLVRSQNVHNHGFETEGLAYISAEQAQKLANVELQENDVLVNITGDSVARVCLLDPTVLPARVNQHVAILRPKPAEIDPLFLRYFLVSPSSQSLLLALASAGATRNALTKSMLESLEIPPLQIDEQRKIGRHLKQLDDKIELNRRMNETLEAMARALFRDWFVDFGPTRRKAEGATDPTAIMGQAFPPEKAAAIATLFPARLEDNGLPNGWGLQPLSDFMSVKHGYAFKGEFFSEDVEQDILVTPGNFRIGGGIKLRKLKYYSGPVDDDYVLKNGDFIVTMTDLSKQGDTLGYPAIVPFSYDKRFLHNQRIGKVNFEGNNLIWPYFYYFMRSPQYRDDILGSASGSTVKHTAPKKILATECIFNDEVVRAFSELVASFEEKIAANQQENQTLAEMRDLLLPKLMSGKIRLKDAEEAV